LLDIHGGIGFSVVDDSPSDATYSVSLALHIFGICSLEADCGFSRNQNSHLFKTRPKK
jgi:hypothetical protein